MNTRNCILAAGIVLWGFSRLYADVGSVDLAGADVVLPDAPEKWERLAAEDLAEALSRPGGARSRVVGESSRTNASGVCVYVGKTRAATRAGIDLSRLSEQEFRVKTQERAVFVAGGRPTGTAYGVNDLLASRFGVYMLDAGVSTGPKDPLLRLPTGLDYVRKPAIRFRDVYRRYDTSDEVSAAARAEMARFRRRNYLAYSFPDLPPDCRPTCRLQASHTFHQLVPPAEFSKTHPEWFSLSDSGRRSFNRFGGQLCLTNPEMRREAERRLLEIIAADRRQNPASPPGLYEVSQSDDTPRRLCACEKCRARSEELGGENGILLDFVNELAAHVAEKHPDVSIRTFAYECTERPAKVAPAPNVIVRYCDYYSKHVDLYPLEDPENAPQLALYESWVARKCRLELWDYLLYTFSSGALKFEVGLPATSVDSVIADARLFARTGLERIFVEAEYARRHPKSFRKLEYFLLAQMMFDPQQDAEGLIDAFMKGYYGPAADEMAAFLSLLRTAQRTHRTSLAGWKKLELAHLTPDFVRAADALLARALAKVEGDVARTGRVADEYANVLRAEMNLTAGRRGREADFAQALAQCRKMDEARVRAAAWMTEKARAAFAAALRTEHDVYGARAYGELPAELKDVDPARLIGVPSHCRSVTNGKVAKDPDSAMPSSIFWLPPAESRFRHGLPMTVGVYSGRDSRCERRIAEVPPDGRYHWYRVGSVTLSRHSYVYLSADWRQRMMLGDWFLQGEGVDNEVEVWVSMKFRGPSYVKGSADPDEAATDRVLLVRK